MTALSDRPWDTTPMHDRTNIQPGSWFACEHPERPPDSNGYFDARCRSCVLALGASARSGRIIEQISGQRHDTAALYERLRHHHGLPPLPANQLVVDDPVERSSE